MSSLLSLCEELNLSFFSEQLRTMEYGPPLNDILIPPGMIYGGENVPSLRCAPSPPFFPPLALPFSRVGFYFRQPLYPHPPPLMSRFLSAAFVSRVVEYLSVLHTLPALWGGEFFLLARVPVSPKTLRLPFTCAFILVCIPRTSLRWLSPHLCAMLVF